MTTKRTRRIRFAHSLGAAYRWAFTFVGSCVSPNTIFAQTNEKVMATKLRLVAERCQPRLSDSRCFGALPLFGVHLARICLGVWWLCNCFLTGNVDLESMSKLTRSTEAKLNCSIRDCPSVFNMLSSLPFEFRFLLGRPTNIRIYFRFLSCTITLFVTSIPPLGQLLVMHIQRTREFNISGHSTRTAFRNPLLLSVVVLCLKLSWSHEFLKKWH